MIEVYYHLVDTFENYKYFDTVEEVQKWLRDIGEDMFVYVDMLFGDVYVDNFSAILEYTDEI